MEEVKNSSLTLDNRKKLTLTGVLEVISYDDEKISLNTKLGGLDIKGSNLKVNKFDVQNGDVIFVGTISYMVYSDKEVNKDKKKIIKKLFK